MAVKNISSKMSTCRLRADDHFLVAAIDFGTTYSGYAFLFRHDYIKNPTKIHTNRWISSSSDGAGATLKTPTCLLINSKDKKEIYFGYEAEGKMQELDLDKKLDGWYFFKHFKMTLHHEAEIHSHYKIKDVFGVEMKALTVFSLSIGYLKDHLLKSIHDQFPDLMPRDKDIVWVITVPAIWKDSAKKFMRKAAKKAGIPMRQLTIALEPEAASLLCRELSIGNEASSRISTFKEGSRYMILDCGGGTVDITVHEVLSHNKLKEIHKATGGHLGGTKVNEAFRNFLVSLVGAKDLLTYQEHHKSDYLNIFYAFEVKKRNIPTEGNDKITLHLPLSFFQTFQDLELWVQETHYKDNVQIVGDKIRIHSDLFREFFKDTIESICLLVEDILRCVGHLEVIMMVGGFSESSILQKAIKDKFESKTKIIIPADASLCVMKGAVLWGHDPDIIASRKSRFTYGVALTVPFKKGIHPIHKKLVVEGEELCDDIFDKHVEIGQSVSQDEYQSEKEYYPLTDRDTILPIELYSSTSTSPKFVTDPSCKCIGKFSVKFPDDLGAKKEDRKVMVRMKFGSTDIVVEAIDKSGKIHTMKYSSLKGRR
ncbi:hypothetical protein CHS0354_039858 [Potamilus streckersoni]|uniref:Uncharacterized protein n=1 Tax=Potamilus streckersoni TaxID=2493646 RepID=A0AAE0VZW3_9BIVA|nr:hypothetical protein CHS0354_039858 [Potamilus streckersoni]